MNVWSQFFKSRRKRAETLNKDPQAQLVRDAVERQAEAGSRLLATVTAVLDENARLRAMARENNIAHY